MKRLSYTSFFLALVLFTVNCEIENNAVEIISFSASDSVALSGIGIMLYCEAEDGDGEINYHIVGKHQVERSRPGQIQLNGFHHLRKVPTF